MLMLDGSSLAGLVALFQLNPAMYHSMTEGSTSIHHGNDVRSSAKLRRRSLDSLLSCAVHAQSSGRRSPDPQWVDIVAKRFLVLERRTIFSHLDRIENFDSQNRPFGFYYCRISLAGPLRGDFCNKIGHGLPCRVAGGTGSFYPESGPPGRRSPTAEILFSKAFLAFVMPPQFF